MNSQSDAPPKVCVGISTYNQASYVGQAIESVLGQITSFRFEIVIHDDASDDGTQEILREYASRYPDIIRLILQTENQLRQGRRVMKIMLPHLKSAKYIAFLDGDDAWISKDKLATQVEFLEENPGCAICQTRTRYFDERSGEVVRTFPPAERSNVRHDLNDLAQRNFIQTSATMFRTSAVPELTDDFDELPYGDYALFSLIACNGWIGHINSEMTLYRIHGDNFWATRTSKDTQQKRDIVRAFIAKRLPQEDRVLWLQPSAAPQSQIKKLKSRVRQTVRRLSQPLFNK